MRCQERKDEKEAEIPLFCVQATEHARIFFNRVGRFWGNQDVEIDIVAYDSFGNDMILRECKYSINPKGVNVLYNLEQISIYVDWKK